MRFRVVSDGFKYIPQVFVGTGWMDYGRKGPHFSAKYYFPTYKSAVDCIKEYHPGAVIEKPQAGFRPVAGPVVREEIRGARSRAEVMEMIQSIINQQNKVENDEVVKRLDQIELLYAGLSGALQELQKQVQKLQKPRAKRAVKK